MVKPRFLIILEKVKWTLDSDGKYAMKPIKAPLIKLKAELVSAKNLNENEVNDIKEELTKNFGSKIKLNYTHDASLIGGLIVQVGSTMVDTSIKNKLQQIENRMIEA